VNQISAESELNILALIPARAGSKGIPGKNLRELGGVPLVGHAIECARRVPECNRIVLSTDSAEMLEIGRAFGAETPFIRPSEFATDYTPMLAVLQHAVRTLSESGWMPEIIVLLQPTAPFRRVEDISAAIRQIQSSPEIDSIVSVEEIPSHYSPHFVMKIVDNCLVPYLVEGAAITRRQDAPRAYSRNGQFYIIRRNTLVEKESIYGDCSIPFITSHLAVNLDTLDDWEAAESLVQRIGLPLK
jgi:CMP-N-acetylneuraminic acid synthetase